MILKLVQVKIFKVAALFIHQLKAKTKRSKNQRLWIPKWWSNIICQVIVSKQANLL